MNSSTITEPASQRRPRSLRSRSMSMTCSACSLGCASVRPIARVRSASPAARARAGDRARVDVPALHLAPGAPARSRESQGPPRRRNAAKGAGLARAQPAIELPPSSGSRASACASGGRGWPGRRRRPRCIPARGAGIQVVLRLVLRHGHVRLADATAAGRRRAPARTRRPARAAASASPASANTTHARSQWSNTSAARIRQAGATASNGDAGSRSVGSTSAPARSRGRGTSRRQMARARAGRGAALIAPPAVQALAEAAWPAPRAFEPPVARSASRARAPPSGC